MATSYDRSQPMLPRRLVALPLILFVSAGCSDDGTDSPTGSGGNPGAGGTASGGSGTGGARAGGGTSNSGGSVQSGGAPSSGGTPDSTGGATSSGGALASGGTVGGTGGADAGTGGAFPGTGGETAAGGSSVSDCSALPTCDDFEGGTAGMPPDPTKWTTILDYGLNGDPSKVVIDLAEQHSGSKSVRVDGVSGVWGFSPLEISNTFFLRVWMKVPDTGTSTPVVIGVNEATSGGQPDFQKEARLRIFPNSTDGAIYFSGNDASDGGLYPDATDGNGCPTCTVVPTDWFCVEMHFDASAPAMTVWINGTEAVSVPSAASWNWPAQVDFVRFGVLALGGTGPSVWYDDVAFGDQRLGCD